MKSSYIRTEETRRKLSESKKVKNKYDLSGEYGIGWTQNGYEFYFDKEDYELIKNYCWHKHQDGYLRTRYDCVNGHNKYILMHRLIMVGFDKDRTIEVDHRNGKPNDNQKDNMRVTTHAENMKNIKLSSACKFGVNGVNYNKLENKYKANISGKHLGTFENLEDAITARKQAEIEIYGEYLRKDGDKLNGTR